MMKYRPHKYQEYATRFIVEHPEAAIFLDCGLGKTVIALTAVEELMHDRFEVGRALIIAPLRVARDTWPEEIRKWDHLAGITYAVAVGSTAARIAALKERAEVTIINRENVDWLVRQKAFDFDMVVVDELSSFKSHRSRRFQSLMRVRPTVKRIVGLTGTPSSNGLMDLFAEFRLLDMGKRLGRFIGQYRSKFFLPDKRNGMVVYSYKPQEDAEKRIYGKIADITISMRAADYLKMPELVSTEVEVTLSDRERKLYDRLKKELVLQAAGGEITASNAAALTGKLTQLANGAVYGDDGRVMEIHQRKLDALEDIVEAANGKPVLVAYWYRHDFERIRQRFPGAEAISDTSSIRKWNRGEIAIGLIHPASAGHGLNLQEGGSHLVWFGLTWSLELYQQTNARLYRQGQKSGTVVVQHLVTKGTIDQRILRALEKKDLSQEALMEAVKAEAET